MSSTLTSTASHGEHVFESEMAEICIDTISVVWFHLAYSAEFENELIIYIVHLRNERLFILLVFLPPSSPHSSSA